MNNAIKRMNAHRENAITDSPLDVLKKYELLRDGKISNACFLLFMKGISSVTTIELGRFQTETIIKDELRIKGDIISEVERVMVIPLLMCLRINSMM